MAGSRACRPPAAPDRCVSRWRWSRRRRCRPSGWARRAGRTTRKSAPTSACGMKNFDHATSDGKANMAALRAAIAEAQEGDCFLLHGCCHNPTGIDYSNDDWDEIAALIVGKKLLPLLDLAYQGLGAGMEEDAYGVRRVLAAVPEAIVAYSCDKNFGLYRDRTGALYVMMAEPGQLKAAMSNGHALARANWSQPPDHGAAAARIVHGGRGADPPVARRARHDARPHAPGPRAARRGGQGRRGRSDPDRAASTGCSRSSPSPPSRCRRCATSTASISPDRAGSTWPG